MNYFELYEILESFHLDASLIKKKFYALSRSYHPDFHSNANEADQQEVLEKSALINKAFKVFNNADETIKYLLQLKGLLADEEKYSLPPDFLMEVMELNEELMEAKMEENIEMLTRLKKQITNLETSIYEPVKEIMATYQADRTTEKELLQVKEYYYKKKYLGRILASIH